MSFYVRTGNNGADPDVFIRDLGITVSTGAGWIELSAYNSAGFSTGQFTAEKLVASFDLYTHITTFALEASSDGTTNNIDGYSYAPITPLLIEILDNPNGIDLTDSSLVLPNTTDAATLITNPLPGQIAFDSDDGYIVFYDGYGWSQVGEGAASSGDFSNSDLILPTGVALPAQPAGQGRVFALNDGGNIRLYVSDGGTWDLIGPTFGGGGGSGLWFLDGNTVQLINDGYILRVDEIQFSDGSIEITDDGYGNMLFIDGANPSGLTLSDLFSGGTGGFNPGYWDLIDGYILQPISDGYVVRANEYQVGDEQIQITSDGYGNLVLTDAGGTTNLTALKSMRNIWIEGDGYVPGNITLSDATNWAAQYTYISTINVITSSTNWDLWLCETSAFNTNLSTSRRIVRQGLRSTIVDVNFEVNSDSNNLYLVYSDSTGNDNTASFYVIGEARRH